MNSANQWGAYLEHLQAEHHRLNLALLAIRHQLAALRDRAQPQTARDSVIDRLEGLLQELRSHFAEEEEGGCLEEALVRCQSVGPNVKALLNEHPQLTRPLEHLIARMKSRTIGVDECQPVFETFAAKLKAHECGENRLLQFALGGDASDYDVEGNE